MYKLISALDEDLFNFQLWLELEELEDRGYEIKTIKKLVVEYDGEWHYYALIIYADELEDFPAPSAETDADTSTDTSTDS